MGRSKTRSADRSGVRARGGVTALERGVLLACVRAALRRSGVSLPTDVAAQINWAHFIDAALQHGVMPLVYEALQGAPATVVPAEMMTRLRQAYHANASRNLARTHALIDIVSTLERRNIPTLSIKGPVLADSAYGSLGRRQFSDIDVVVPASLASRASAVLQSAGFIEAHSSASAVTMVVSTASPRICVDLQWAFADAARRFPLDMRDVWNRCEPYRLLDASVRRLEPVDELLLLTAHPAKHCWSRLGWITDVAAFIDTHASRIDWDVAFARARRLGGVRLLCVGLQLAATVAGARLPKRVRATLKDDPMARRLAIELRRRLFLVSGNRLPLNGAYGMVDSMVLECQLRERWRDRLPLAIDRAREAMQLVSFTPTDQDRDVVALSPSMRALYFGIRPLRLTLKYGPRVPRWLWRAAVAVTGR